MFLTFRNICVCCNSTTGFSKIYWQTFLQSLLLYLELFTYTCHLLEPWYWLQKHAPVLLVKPMSKLLTSPEYSNLNGFAAPGNPTTNWDSPALASPSRSYCIGCCMPFALWAFLWQAHPFFYCDNQSVVSNVGSKRSRIPRVMDLVPHLTLLTLNSSATHCRQSKWNYRLPFLF